MPKQHVNPGVPVFVQNSRGHQFSTSSVARAYFGNATFPLRDEPRALILNPAFTATKFAC